MTRKTRIYRAAEAASATQTATKAPRKPRTKRDPNDFKQKLQERIKKLQEQLSKAQTTFAVEADPKIAAKVASLKRAKAQLAAANRLIALRSKKLRRLVKEVAEYEVEIDRLKVEQAQASARVAELTPEVEAVKAGLSEDTDTEPEDSGEDVEE